MWPVSERFAEALTTHHTRVAKAVLLNNQKEVFELPVTDGSVTIDTTALIRRRATVVIQGREDLVPGMGTDYLFPRINEIKLYSGIQFDPGDPDHFIPPDEEYVPLGVFRPDESGISMPSAGVSISIDCYDRADRASGNRLTDIYVVKAGQIYSDAIKALVQYADPRAQFNFTQINYRTPQMILDIGSDPWDEATKMASAIGCDLYYDANGICTLTPELDPSTAPTSWSYLEGQGNLLIDAERKISGSYGYNHVALRGFNSTGEEGPVIAEAWDADPNSPTFAGDPPGSSDYGLVTYFISSQFVNTSAQAQAFVNSQLLRVLGAGETVSANAIANPAHEGGDVVRLRWSPLKMNGRYVMQSATIPLTSGRMSFETRRRQVR